MSLMLHFVCQLMCNAMKCQAKCIGYFIRVVCTAHFFILQGLFDLLLLFLRRGKGYDLEVEMNDDLPLFSSFNRFVISETFHLW